MIKLDDGYSDDVTYTWEHFREEGECLLICTRVISCIMLGRKCASDTTVVWK